jgi:ubiquinone/menaquinone biosynthesis C-methylase UbiE
MNEVDNFWTNHTIISDTKVNEYKCVGDSISSLNERMNTYLKFTELMQLDEKHKDKIILDYGCGAGHDLVRFADFSEAKTVIGMDISQTALNHAQKRLNLHDFKNVKLLKIESDEICELPFKDNTIDYIHSCGVLHHTSNMQKILSEFSRIMKDDACGNIMVYNYDSIFLHLYIAYFVKQVAKWYSDTPKNIFKTISDGGNCPIAEIFKPEEFIDICENNNLKCEFSGGYLSTTEIQYYNTYVQETKNSCLNDESREFAKNLTVTSDGLIMYKGKYAGLGGSFKIYKK